MMTSKLSSIIRRWSSVSMPSIVASDVSWPGPTPNIIRPRVRWSSMTMRSARISGWWYGSELTPVPSLMCSVVGRGVAMNTSGEAIVSNPLEWCSPIHASSKPSASRCSISSRSRLHQQCRVLARPGASAAGRCRSATAADRPAGRSRRSAARGSGSRSSVIPSGLRAAPRALASSRILTADRFRRQPVRRRRVGRWTRRPCRIRSIASAQRSCMFVSPRPMTLTPQSIISTTGRT